LIMADLQVGPIETAIEGVVDGIWSVTEDLDGNLYVICKTGDIFSVVDRQCQQLYNTGGQPTSLTFDSQGSAYICDQAHQAILCQTDVENRVEVTPIVRDYESKPLLGPNTVVLSEHNNFLYFTDSGPMGESTISNPKGSLYAADLDLLVLKPIILNCLAHPSGLTFSNDEKVIFLAETLKNRVLRIAHKPLGVPHVSVFYQFSGRLGPTALAMSENNLLYVAHFDYAEYSKNGQIAVIDMEGHLVNSFTLPNAPEITGLYVSRHKPNLLYITESSTGSCYRLVIPSESS